MSKVQTILKKKGYGCVTISANKTVLEALNVMSVQNIGALVVTEGQKVLGVFSERDYARKVILQGRNSQSSLVKDLVSDTHFIVSEETTTKDCMALMTNKRVRHLPVMNKEKLIGIVSIGDIVKQIISEKEKEINQLTDYILGNRLATH